MVRKAWCQQRLGYPLRSNAFKRAGGVRDAAMHCRSGCRRSKESGFKPLIPSRAGSNSKVGRFGTPLIDDAPPGNTKGPEP